MHARSLVIITLLLGKKKSKYYSVYILDAQGINKFYFLDESLKNELVQGILCKSMKKNLKTGSSGKILGDILHCY